MMHRLLSLLTALLGFSTALSADLPNFVVIFTDDQGWNDVGCYGKDGMEASGHRTLMAWLMAVLESCRCVAPSGLGV